MGSKPKPHKLRQLRVQQMKRTGCHDKGTAVAILSASACWARRLYIRPRQHLATLHIQKVLSQSPVSPGCGRCQAPFPTTLQAQPPATTCCSWTLARSVYCGLLLIKNSHSWQRAPAVMILWDSSRPFEILLSGQLFGVGPKTRLRILNRNDCFHRLQYHCQ